jgi:CheY-like chemotaxis protein
LKELLSDFKSKIIRTENGKEAEELCKYNPKISLVLMDLKMPEMDGYEATKRIKKMKPELSVIARIAFFNESDKAEAFICAVMTFYVNLWKEQN